jgi:hypothetical protein
MEITEAGILIRPPESGHPSHEGGVPSGEQEPAPSEPMDVSSSLLKIWRSLKSKFARVLKNPNGDET